MCRELIFSTVMLLVGMVCTAQVDTVLSWNGIEHFRSIDSSEVVKSRLNRSNLSGPVVRRELPSDLSRSTLCFFPILLMGEDQIDFYAEISLDDYLTENTDYTIILDLGIYDTSGYYPDTLMIWSKSLNTYALRQRYPLAQFALNNLCHHQTRRFTANISLPESSKLLEIGSNPFSDAPNLKGRKTKQRNVAEVHPNMNFCKLPVSLSEIPAGDAPLIYIERITITK